MCVLTYLHGWNKIHFDGHTYLFHATSKEEEMIGSHAAWTEALHQSVTTHDTLKSHKTVPPDHLRSGALYLGIDSAIVPNPSRMSHVVISKLQSERNAALRCVQTISYYRDYEIPTCKKNIHILVEQFVPHDNIRFIRRYRHCAKVPSPRVWTVPSKKPQVVILKLQ